MKIKKCKQCQSKFETDNPKKIFCSRKCLSKYHYNKRMSNRKEYRHKCAYCGKNFKSEREETKYCSFQCSGKSKNQHGTGKTKSCPQCGIEFNQKHSRHKYCSDFCKVEYNKENGTKKKFKCENCGKIFYRHTSRKNASGRYFCSNSCVGEYNTKVAQDVRVCEVCKQKFTTNRSSTQRLCSLECQHEWQSINRVGENHHAYIERIEKKCKNCGGVFSDLPSGIDSREFCSKYCVREYTKREHTKISTCSFCGKEFKQKTYMNKEYCSRKCSLNAQSSNSILSKPHRKTIAILKNLRVWYRKEYPIDRYIVDCFLGKRMIIEVQGGYWHVDPRIHSGKTKKEKRFIEKDKRKKDFFEKNDYKVLYIWEDDINSSPEMCEKLIKEFSKNNGKLENYHSMNYSIDKGNLTLNKGVIYPYFENK